MREVLFYERQKKKNAIDFACHSHNYWSDRVYVCNNPHTGEICSTIEDIQEYPNSILVKQTWHTGTGWEIVGDENGLYTDSSNIYDVQLEGNVPPLVGMGGDHANTFLCEVIPAGTFQIPGTTSSLHQYEKLEVINWYPIYPVKRDTMLPSWLFSDEYLSKFDFI